LDEANSILANLSDPIPLIFPPGWFETEKRENMRQKFRREPKKVNSQPLKWPFWWISVTGELCCTLAEK
jgi:hypothetical protein